MKRAVILIAVAAITVVGFLVFKHPAGAPDANNSNFNNMITITSSAFQFSSQIPEQYSCDGAGVNPPLTFGNVPENAKSLALIIDDPDAPGGTFTHWLVFNINPRLTEISENSLPMGGQFGRTSAGGTEYVAACPPSGTHHYHFKVFALDAKLDLKSGATRKSIESAMSGHVIDQGELIGLYQRN